MRGGKCDLGLDQAGLGGGDVGRSGRRSQCLELGLGLGHLGLGGGEAGLGAALLQRGEVGLRLDHGGLGLLEVFGAGVQQRVELGLGVGDLLLGQWHLCSLVLARRVVGDLRLLNRQFGVVQGRFGLHERIVILLALRVVQGVVLALALGVGPRRVDRVVAGLLDVVPVPLRHRVPRLGLGQGIDGLLHLVVGVGLGLREAIALVLQLGLGLRKLHLRGADRGRCGVLQGVEPGLCRLELGLRVLEIGHTGRPGLPVLGLRALELGPGGRQILWGRRATPGLGQPGLGRFDVGLGLLELELKLTGVDLCQHLAGLDLVADVDIDCGDGAGLLKRQIDRARCRDRATAAHQDGQGALADRSGDRRRWRRARLDLLEDQARDQHQGDRNRKPTVPG